LFLPFHEIYHPTKWLIDPMTRKFLPLGSISEKSKGCLRLGFGILNMGTKNYLLQQTAFQKRVSTSGPPLVRLGTAERDIFVASLRPVNQTGVEAVFPRDLLCKHAVKSPTLRRTLIAREGYCIQSP
jgi:hypothetical protein